MPPLPTGDSLPPVLAKRLEDNVEARLRKRFGIKDGDPTPAELKQLITTEVKKAGTPLVKIRVAGEVQSVLGSLAEARTLERFGENLQRARNGIKAIAAANEVNEILKNRAELLFKKKTALETAGFTSDQAMQIVLADLESRAH